MAALSTSVAATTKSLATSIATRRCCLCARKLDHRLATGTVSVQRQGAGWTRSGWVANVVTIVESTGEQGTARVATFKLWSRARSWLFRLLTFAALDRSPLAWCTVSRVTSGRAEVSSTAKPASTLLPARPGCSGASSGDWRGLTTVASLLHCLRAGGAGPRVAEEGAFVRAAS